MTIHKVTLDQRRMVYEMPRGARFLSAGCQGPNVVLWYLCDPAEPIEERRILVLGTGHVAPDDIADWTFVSTVQYTDGLVFHLFVR